MKIKGEFLHWFNKGDLNNEHKSIMSNFCSNLIATAFICIMAFPFSIHAQYKIVKPAISGRRYPPSVTRVAEDSRGFIWYLTNDGLYRYDGQRSVYLKKELKILGFKGSPTEMLIDSNDHLWLASKGCFAFLDIKKWKIFKAPASLLNPEQADDVRKMDILPDGKVFIGYKSGYILVGSNKGFQKIDEIYKQPTPIGRPLSYAAATRWKNSYWISTDHGRLFKIDTALKANSLKEFIITKDNSSIIKLMPWKDELLCKGPDGSLYNFNGNTPSLITSGDFSAQTHQNHLQDETIQMGESYLYINKKGPSRKEFLIFSNEMAKHTVLYIDSSDILSDAYINDIVYNKKSGTIILGTSQGIYILFKSLPKIAQLVPFNGLPNRSVRGMFCFSDGDIFYAGYSGSGLWGKKHAFLSREYRAIYCMLPIGNHQLLLGIEGGFLKSFDKKNLTYSDVVYHIEPRYKSLFSKYIFAMVLHAGKYYFGTIKGVWTLDSVSRKLSPLTDGKGVPVSAGLQIKSLLWHHGLLYIASQNGLYVWSGTRLKRLFPRNESGSQDIYDITADEKGLWLATLNEGLIRLDYTGKEIKRLNTETGLNTNVIFSLLNTGEMLIAGTDRGLILIKKDSVRLLGEEDGLQQLEFNHGASFYDAKSKTAYMGGLNGYTKLDVTKRWFQNEPAKPVYIGTISINGKNQAENNEIYNLSYTSDLKIILHPGQEYLSISIATPLSYVYRYDPEYKIAGVSDLWQTLEEGQPVSLLGLKSGHYSLRVKAAGSFRPGKILELGIQKMPEFYQTWWFGCLLLILSAGVIYVAYRNRIQKAREESMLRTRIASDLHDEVGGILTGMSLQAEFLLYKGSENNQSYLKQIAESGREAVLTMGDIVWSVDSRNDNTAELLMRMRDYLLNVLEPKGIQSQFDNGEYYPTIPQLIRQNTYLIFKEAINNISKHSGATQVKISMRWENKLLKLSVSDNGTGINLSHQGKGQGLNNMKMRAERIKAKISITSDNPGTLIVLEVPIKV